MCQKVRQYLKIDGACKAQEPVQGGPSSQVWDNLSPKIIKDSGEL